MAQVFARYAKDILERQTYPEVRRSPTSPPEPPYDVTAWSLGMLLGVDHVVVRRPLADGVEADQADGGAEARRARHRHRDRRGSRMCSTIADPTPPGR